MGYNVQFPVPLSEQEVKAIAKSIAKWNHRRFTEKTFADYVARTHTPEIQAARGLRNTIAAQVVKGAIGGKISHGGGRPIIATSIEQLKPWEALGISRATYYRHKAKGLL